MTVWRTCYRTSPYGKKKGKGRATSGKTDEKALNADSEITCLNCKGKGHKKADCWLKDGGKEGQGPKQKGKGKGKKTETATVAASNDEDKEFFAFTCMSNFANVAEALQVTKSRLRTCIDSGVYTVRWQGQWPLARGRPWPCPKRARVGPNF